MKSTLAVGLEGMWRWRERDGNASTVLNLAASMLSQSICFSLGLFDAKSAQSQVHLQ